MSLDSPVQNHRSIKILVTGAAGGNQGATGRRVTELLLQDGFSVRAFVRIQDERSERLHKLGAEIVVGDLRDISAVRAALEGISRAYFCYPLSEDFLEAASILAIAAKQRALETVVHLSHGSANDTSLSRASRRQWQAEQIFNWADIGAVHLLGALFFENLVRLAGPGIAKEGKIFLPLGDGSGIIPTVAGTDIARVAANILADPDKHKGKAYYVSGPQQFTIREIAGIFSRVLKRPVDYVQVPLETWQENFARVARPSAYLLQHLSSTLEMFARLRLQTGREGPPGVEQITASNPVSLESFLRENAEAEDRFWLESQLPVADSPSGRGRRVLLNWLDERRRRS